MDLQSYENFEWAQKRCVNISYRTAPAVFPLHWHTQGELIFSLEDHNIYSVNNVTYELSKGDILFVWPTELHENIKIHPCSSLILQFENSLLEQVKEAQMIESRLRNYHHFKYSEHPEFVSSIHQKLYKMKDYYIKQEFLYELPIVILFYEIILELGHYQNNLNDSAESFPCSNEAIQKIIMTCHYLQDNLEKDLSLEDAADYSGFSRYYFSRLFHEYTSLPFLQWINQKRVEKAVLLFPQTSLSITDVAMLSGFKSISSFNRVFRQIKGCTPTECRNMYDTTN